MAPLHPTPKISKTTTDPSTHPVRGTEAIRHYVIDLPAKPGVYRMLDESGEVLYVGKARNLKKRVTTYTSLNRHASRVCRMIQQTTRMEFITTETEAEALLLEANLIKTLAPRYNILLRDDKSFPAILLTGDHDFPQVAKHRGAHKRKGYYFGPFASVWAVNETVSFLQRVFLLRTCSDSVFQARTRPCLLHQINRCTAPCVGRISKDDYAGLVKEARAFLEGKSRNLQERLAEQMQAASNDMAYEEAALHRDRIRALSRIQAKNDVVISTADPLDVIAIHREGAYSCIQVFFFRGGNNNGNKAFFPSHGADEHTDAIMSAFMSQFYHTHPAPKHILLNAPCDSRALIAEALSLHSGRKVEISLPTRGARLRLIRQGEENAKEALARRLSENTARQSLMDDLGKILDLPAPPERIEVYDNSHTGGKNAVGAMVVAGREGYIKNAWRKFNIKGTEADQSTQPSTPFASPVPATAGGLSDSAMTTFTHRHQYNGGDDYAMMEEVLTRRFSRLQREDPNRTTDQWPDVILIDGGKGQLGIAQRVLDDLGIQGVCIAAVSKGPDRNAGREKIWLPDREPIRLESRNPVLYYIQRLRDEAHRFAIDTHRHRRGKSVKRSALDDIPNIGAARKRALLHHFGSPRAVQEASAQDLRTVNGISATLAQKIHDWFHG